MLSPTVIASAFLTLIVYIPIPIYQSDSGANERLGQVIVKNAIALTPDQITHIAGLKPRQPVNDRTIKQALERIRKAYLQRGFIHAKSSIHKEMVPHSSEKNQIVNLQITIDEGPSFSIRRTEVVGNQRTNHNVVMRAVGGLRPGQPYNPDHVEKWIRGLNRSGRFARVKRGDIEINIDKEGHFVDLLFHLKEKPGLRILRGLGPGVQ